MRSGRRAEHAAGVDLMDHAAPELAASVSSWPLHWRSAAALGPGDGTLMIPSRHGALSRCAAGTLPCVAPRHGRQWIWLSERIEKMRKKNMTCGTYFDAPGF
jgi:hypothetical protein